MVFLIKRREIVMFAASAAALSGGRAFAQAKTGSGVYPVAVPTYEVQFVAMEKGFFKKNGVDVTGILTAAGGGTAVRNTLAGGIPFGEVSLAAAVQAINAGQKLIIIGAGAWSVADQMWLVKKDSTLKGIKDLVGKQIAYTAPGSVSNMLILMALKANGMTPQQEIDANPIVYFDLRGVIDAAQHELCPDTLGH